MAPLGPAEIAFAREEFRRYYEHVRVEPPPRFARREYAAFPFAGEALMRRHAAFRSEEEFRRFLPREAPRHVYYSSAYYRTPEHPKMNDKGWLGADLIFDLDADHLRGAEGLAYPAQLDLVRRRFLWLLQEFLFGDLGVDPESVALVFSGGRGYHAHVRDPRYFDLTSAERRELVDYIQSGEVDLDRVLSSERERGEVALSFAGSGAVAEKPSGRQKPFLRIGEVDAPGWVGRVRRGILERIGAWERDGPDAAVRDLVGAGVPERDAKAIARALVGTERGQWLREHHTLEVPGLTGERLEHFLRAMLERTRVEVQGETDAPVTTDVHRLIRLPGSRHGGTGLVARPVRLEELEAGFDPLREAVAPNDGAGTVRVRARAKFDYRFADVPLAASAGEEVELPRNAAAFVVLRGEAELTPPSADPS